MKKDIQNPSLFPQPELVCPKCFKNGCRHDKSMDNQEVSQINNYFSSELSKANYFKNLKENEK